jgi:hypothetical protein
MRARAITLSALLLTAWLNTACTGRQPAQPTAPAALPTSPPTAPDQPIGSPPSDQPVEARPTPQPGAPQQEGPVYIDEVELIMLESYPVQVRLILRGSLPNPCSRLGWEVEQPDAQGRIQVRAYSVQESDLACIQVLAPLEDGIPLGAFTSGSFSVWLNGEQVADFEL